MPPISRVWSASTLGIEATPVEIETCIRGGLPGYAVVGLPNASVRESRDRVWSALRSSGLPLPHGAITVNMAPADVRKEGALFDLPLAIGLLAAAGTFGAFEPNCYIVGELALDGRVRPVRGVLSIALAARRAGASSIVVPVENAAEASLVHGLPIWPVANLRECVARLLGERLPVQDLRIRATRKTQHHPDFSDVAGQGAAKRALEIAAAGGHHIMLFGPPGSGKTMLARRLPGILPPLLKSEALEATQIHSIAGLLDPAMGLVRERPFRAPHHAVSRAGLTGGGDPPRPGEISLAHRGVLFLDELPEFSSASLEALRQPIEDGTITIRRARYGVTFPAGFMLVASMNPCPCGRTGRDLSDCLCDPGVVRRYRSRVSAPLLDRIDIRVEVAPLTYDAIASPGGPGQSADMRARVKRARGVQRHRYRGRAGVQTNAAMTIRDMRVSLTTPANTLLRDATDRLKLSARAVHRIRRVAQTIADLGAVDAVRAEHIAEAVQYRGSGAV